MEIIQIIRGLAWITSIITLGFYGYALYLIFKNEKTILRKIGYSLVLTLMPAFSIYAILDYKRKNKLKEKENEFTK